MKPAAPPESWAAPLAGPAIFAAGLLAGAAILTAIEGLWLIPLEEGWFYSGPIVLASLMPVLLYSVVVASLGLRHGAGKGPGTWPRVAAGVTRVLGGAMAVAGLGHLAVLPAQVAALQDSTFRVHVLGGSFRVFGLLVIGGTLLVLAAPSLVPELEKSAPARAASGGLDPS